MIRMVIELEEEQESRDMPDSKIFLNLGDVGLDRKRATLENCKKRLWLTGAYNFLKTDAERHLRLRGHVVSNVTIIRNIGLEVSEGEDTNAE